MCSNDHCQLSVPSGMGLKSTTPYLFTANSSFQNFVAVPCSEDHSQQKREMLVGPIMTNSDIFVQVLLLLSLIETAITYEVSGVKVHQVLLHQNDQRSPFCYAASSALDVMDASMQSESGTTSINFLASQVWPSARVAASALEKYMDPAWTVCEFGCGPGLPSLTAAKLGARKVFATDVDQFALDLVDHASRAQDLSHIVSTTSIDITKKPVFLGSANAIPKADLYLFSDIFESPDVAVGAALVTQAILQSNERARIWVFAQADRACREDYLSEMKRHLDDPHLSWAPLERFQDRKYLTEGLICFDLDETKVSYG